MVLKLTMIDKRSVALTGRWRTRLVMVRPAPFRKKQPLLVLQVEWTGVQRRLQELGVYSSNIDDSKKIAETWWADATPNDQAELCRQTDRDGGTTPPLATVAA